MDLPFPATPAHTLRDVADAATRLEQVGYLASPEIATAGFLADRMAKPLLVEGPAGVGKTELARALARALGREFIRLQCYEGLDEAKALYEWEYAKQLLYTQLLYTQLLKDTMGELVRGLVLLNAEVLSVEQVAATLNLVLKHEVDLEKARGQLARIAQA